jgi:sugar (pentulose or hexulose) kinase
MSVSEKHCAVLAPDGVGALGPSGPGGVHFHGDWSSLSDREKYGGLLEGLAHLLTRGVTRFPSPPHIIVAGGGLARIPFLLQRLADFTGVPVAPLLDSETSAWGAARLAALSLGYDLPLIEAGKVLKPSNSHNERASLIRRFKTAIRNSKSAIRS